MQTRSIPECCPLCDGMVDLAQMARHLRALHQVAPGEQTIADVPVAKAWLRVPHVNVEAEEELVEAGAA